jgi:hypothetical protein
MAELKHAVIMKRMCFISVHEAEAGIVEAREEEESKEKIFDLRWVGAQALEREVINVVG